MNLTSQQSALLRHIITLISGVLIAHGLTKVGNFLNVESNIEELLAIAGIVYSLVSSHYSNTPDAIVQKAAEIVPQGTVIVATTDAAPKAPAQVLSPEEATTFVRKTTP